MPSLAHILSDIVGKAFEAGGLPHALGAVRVSDRPDLAQFQCNGAMAAAKIAGKKPREVAEGVVERLSSPPLSPPPAGGNIFSKLEIAGPGFINFNVTDEFIAGALAEIARAENMGAPKAPPENIVLDYGGPNIAKPMHVGHLRSGIIGDSLRRIFAFAGYKVVSDVHLGDWGLQMGQVLSEMEIRGILNKPVTMDELEEIYPAASAACKADEARLTYAREATLKLQNGDPKYRKPWQDFINVSIAGMKKNFDALGVHFDLWKGESSAHPLIAPMVNELKKKGVAVESDGALVAPVARDGDKKEMPPLILYKSDGAVMYGTTDLATIVERVQENRPAKIIYVVDQRQSLHFEQVFRAARAGGIAPEGVELIHAGFGTMNGPDGKPFKTRAGGVMKLEDLIEQGVEKARARLQEADLAQDMNAAEREDIARKVALAALKFADLQNNRVADYIFDIDRMISFEGKTGPYLLYQAVRIKSLLRKAEYNAPSPNPLPDGERAFSIQDPDRPLALLLCELPDHIEGALKALAPHILCDFAYRLAQAFSAFYASCHILSEPDARLRESRLALCALTYRELALTLDLLGIEIPERM